MSAWTCEDVASLPLVEEAKQFVAYITPDGIWWVLSSVFTSDEPLQWTQLCRQVHATNGSDQSVGQSHNREA